MTIPFQWQPTNKHKKRKIMGQKSMMYILLLYRYTHIYIYMHRNRTKPGTLSTHQRCYYSRHKLYTVPHSLWWTSHTRHAIMPQLYTGLQMQYSNWATGQKTEKRRKWPDKKRKEIYFTLIHTTVVIVNTDKGSLTRHTRHCSTLLLDWMEF